MFKKTADLAEFGSPNKNTKRIGGRIQNNEPLEEEIMEHQGEKMAEDDPTGYPGGEPMGKGDKEESEGMG